MSHPTKIVVTILILAVVLFLVGKFFDFNIQESRVKSYKLDVQGQPIGTTLPKEEGRIITNYGAKIPPSFPIGLPIDKNPLKVLESFTEIVPGDIKEQEIRHIQVTYAYLTQKASSVMVSDFEKYFKKLTFTVDKNTTGALSTLHAEKGNDVMANVTIAVHDQFTRLVTVSLISIERLQIIKSR